MLSVVAFFSFLLLPIVKLKIKLLDTNIVLNNLPLIKYYICKLIPNYNNINTTNVGCPRLE